MKIFRPLKNQAGFTLVQAIFILVVLALLGVVMMRMIGTQSTTSAFALQGARAYQAARSGIEWGAARAAGGNCAPLQTITIGVFDVEVRCASTAFTEGADPPYSVFSLSSVAEFESYGSPSYVQRRVEAKVKLP